MFPVEEQKPVACFTEEGIVFQMDESRVHDVCPFLLQLAEFHHLFAQVAVGEQFFLPFGVHFVAQLLGREVLEVYFLAQFGSELDHLRNDLVPEPARDLFRLSGEDKTHDNRLNFFREARQRLGQGLQPVFDLRIERRAFPIKIKSQKERDERPRVNLGVCDSDGVAEQSDFLLVKNLLQTEP